MKIKVFVLVLSLLLIAPTGAFAQINPLKKVTQKAGESIGKGLTNIKKKSGEETENSSENTEQEVTENSEVNEEVSEKPAAMPKLPFGNRGTTIAHSDNYSFKSRMVMDMTLYDEGKEAGAMTYTLHFSVDDGNGAMVSKGTINSDEGTMPMESTIIMDNSNKCMIMLTNVGGQKMAMISSLDAEAAEQNGKPENVKITKTGRSKTIIGYKCDEYKVEEDKTYSFVWITRDIKHPFTGKEMKSSGMVGFYDQGELSGGMFLETESYDEGKLVAKSVTTEINFNAPFTVSVEGYSMMQFNNRKAKK